MSKQDYRARYAAMVYKAAKDGQTKAADAALAGITEPLYLYHKPTDGKTDGEFRLFGDSEPIPEGWKLTHAEGLRSNVPYANYETWIRTRAGSAPVLAYD